MGSLYDFFCFSSRLRKALSSASEYVYTISLGFPRPVTTSMRCSGGTAAKTRPASTSGRM